MFHLGLASFRAAKQAGYRVRRRSHRKSFLFPLPTLVGQRAVRLLDAG